MAYTVTDANNDFRIKKIFTGKIICQFNQFY